MTQFTDCKSHWEAIYTTKLPNNVSWFQVEPTLSLSMINRSTPNREAKILDVGSGASLLIGSLLNGGYQHITAVDISAAALHVAQQQLGSRAAQVKWIEADVTQLRLSPNSVDVWHDRAVYHFLTRTCDR